MPEVRKKHSGILNGNRSNLPFRIRAKYPRTLNAILGAGTYIIVICFCMLVCKDENYFDANDAHEGWINLLKLFGDAIVPTSVTFAIGIIAQNLQLLLNNESHEIAYTLILLFVPVVDSLLYALVRGAETIPLLVVVIFSTSLVTYLLSIKSLPTAHVNSRGKLI